MRVLEGIVWSGDTMGKRVWDGLDHVRVGQRKELGRVWERTMLGFKAMGWGCYGWLLACMRPVHVHDTTAAHA